MNTSDQIEVAFVAWAQVNDDIRAAVVVGSRARVGHPADEWADPDIYAGLRRVFAHFDSDDGWRAMQARLELFHRLACDVAARLGLDYPVELEAQIVVCIENLRESRQSHLHHLLATLNHTEV